MPIDPDGLKALRELVQLGAIGAVAAWLLIKDWRLTAKVLEMMTVQSERMASMNVLEAQQTAILGEIKGLIERQEVLMERYERMTSEVYQQMKAFGRGEIR